MNISERPTSHESSEKIVQQKNSKNLNFPFKMETKRGCWCCLGQGQIGRAARRSVVIEPCLECSGTGLIPGGFPKIFKPVSPQVDVDVAIIGCGIGGSALALALQQRGISVKVFERDVDFSQRKQGYGLTMQQGAIALAKGDR